MAEPPDIGGSLPLVPPAAAFVTITSNESGMETDGSTNQSSRKRSRPRRICKHCNKHKKKGHNSVLRTTDCQCSDSEISEKSAITNSGSALPNVFVAPPVPQQVQKQVMSPTNAPVFTPVGRKQYDATDSPPYVVHVQKEQLTDNDGTILHPMAFGRLLKKHNIQNIVNGSVKRIGRNRLSLSFVKHTDANAFITHKSLAENKMKAFIPTFSVTRMGLVRGVPAEWSPEEVIENISVPVGCGKILKIRRLNYKVIVDGSPVWKPSQTVVVTFDGQILPKRIFMCYNALTVDLYTYPTIQCYKCCRFGHTKTQCRSNPRCFKCGQGHSGDTCRIEEESFQCCLCNGAHCATDKSCPELMRQKSIKLTMAESCISYAEACKIHPPIFKSYSEMLKSANQEERKTVNYRLHHPNTTSYTKTVYSKPRPSYISPKGYDKAAHNLLIKDYNMPPPSDGCALVKHTDNQSQQSLTDIIAALIIALTQNNILLPSNVAPLIEALNPKIHNNGHTSEKDSSVELSQRN